jgi:ketosteroid isomerase-like protein
MTETRTDFTTSPAPADVVRRQYLASAAADLDALRATLAPDVEWTEMAGFPLAGTYRTPDGVTANVMQRLGADWDGWAAHDAPTSSTVRTSWSWPATPRSTKPPEST